MTVAQEAVNAVAQLTYPTANAPDRAALVQAYRLQADEITNQFAQNLSAQHGTDNDIVDALIFTQAWAQGHSSGYHEVEGHYIDLVEFANQIILAVR